MATEYSLLIQKTEGGSAVKSSLDDFGFVVCDIPWPDEETEELATRKWPGEDGEDVYMSPDGQKLQAYDVVAEFCYKGDVNTANSAYKAFRDYLMGAGGFLCIYDPYWKRGRRGVYVKKFHDRDPHRSNIDEVLRIKVTLRVTDPKTEIALTYVGN